MKLSSAEFDATVERALARIPAGYRRRMANVAIVVEREPRERGLLGLYEGRPLTERLTGEGFQMPDRITIYQGPHERMARNRIHLDRVVYETLWHEIAHYFGMDERQVLMAERRRRTRLKRA